MSDQTLAPPPEANAAPEFAPAPASTLEVLDNMGDRVVAQLSQLSLAWRLGAVGAALTLLFGLAAFAHHRAVVNGTEVTMQATGYDPRDLLSGNFVQLSLQPSQVIVGTSDPAWLKANQQVWVTIRQDASGPALTALAPRRPVAIKPGDIIARGRVDFLPRTGTIPINWPINRAYMSQSDAVAVETALRAARTNGGDTSDVRALVSVGDDGVMRLKGLIVAGQRIEFSIF